MDDMAKSKIYQVISYADDTTIFCSHEDLNLAKSCVQADAEGILAFMASNLLIANPTKTELMGNVERKACRTPHASIDALNASVDQVWADMSEDFVTKVCASFRPRISSMVDAGLDNFRGVKGGPLTADGGLEGH
eukprot:maker-scaffold923_size80782-snap-gene-0.15 protein:Tk06063 transcript:maker-scaffold923_size80782-snap-gene-0.15-mRNA-1 annotation:"hypothetical protein EAG_00091"